ncbi:hypothetical protein FDZ71_05745, partial [bacterium]
MTPGIIVCSETDEGAFELLTKGRELSEEFKMELSALVLGKRNDKEIQCYFEYGPGRLILIPNVGFENLDAETYA